MVQLESDTTARDRQYFLASKILLIDEDADDLGHSAELFEAQGFNVSKCDLYEMGMRSIDKEKFDLIIVDQGSAAFEARLVVRHLNQRQPSTPFVVVAHTTDLNCHIQAMELGAVDYVEKPLSLADVRRVIHNCFGTDSYFHSN